MQITLDTIPGVSYLSHDFGYDNSRKQNIALTRETPLKLGRNYERANKTAISHVVIMAVNRTEVSQS